MFVTIHSPHNNQELTLEQQCLWETPFTQYLGHKCEARQELLTDFLMLADLLIQLNAILTHWQSGYLRVIS